MSQNVSYNSAKATKFVTEEQFEEIVEAILAGKYSWACFLILRYGGYNPLHYIPYRTYNRLIKDNCLGGNAKRAEQDTPEQMSSVISAKERFSQRRASQIEDLDYVEEVKDKKVKVRGGISIFNSFFG
jgi:hypothetical protein